MKSTMDALLVEDSPSDAQLVKAIVSSSNSEKPNLHHVGRFDEALTMLETTAFDIVLLDLHLPDGEGLHLIKQLKQLAPQTPIVVLTGLQDQTIAEAALHEGAQDYVVKSETFSPLRLSKLGYVDVGNLLIQRLKYAIKRAESMQKMESSQERYALVAQGANDGIWDWDLVNDRVYYSPQWQALLGLPDNYISNSPEEWLSRIHPEDRENFEQKFQDYITCRQQQFHCEYRIRHNNGDYLWVLTRGTALWNADGVVYRIAGSQTDMTIRAKVASPPPQQEEFAQTALHAVAIGIMSSLADLYLEEDRYSEAAPLLEGTLMMRKWLWGNTHFDVTLNVYQLATAYDNQGRYKKAKFLYQEALTLFEEHLGAKHHTTNIVRLKVLLINRMNEKLGL
ncbi:PAS domain-containing protein [Leptolyngbya cf. ectocarpi LEGE 11479]|uniref:histidine kinase n=1 Tax=Leptolyngbya cf. ectocarpi LEGE 11479 TaxID=1828722 RepID=A0A928ZVQ3_LEPEC|nr:PAS domain-containing protein [Leptolyngbya ectocarpi]MBE9068357.1 PAS domain-containing protein [Leptolyngbya cf. ectocarpi LEGE 11479]